MATVHDFIEVTNISENTTYSTANGNLLGVVDNVTSSDLNDGEFDLGDTVDIGGVTYTINQIQEPSNAGSFGLGDGSTESFNSGSELNLDVVFLTVSNGGDVRHFIIPNDSYGDMNVQSITTGNLNDVLASDAKVISTGDNQISVVCFTRGTLIEVAGKQQVPIEELSQGDWVMTADHGMKEIKWLGMSEINAQTLAENPQLRPIRIRANALGGGTPKRDLYVSPQHRILAHSKIAQRMFGELEVLVAAKHLTKLKGIRVAGEVESACYYHILLGEHEILFANGAACESLYVGRQALKSARRKARREIIKVFPEIAELGNDLPSSRMLISGRHGRKLAARHSKNGQGLIPPARPKAPYRQPWANSTSQTPQQADI
ncbi:MAG: Hint domain-containing protein [Paracoccaceae bacterium]